MPSNDLVKSENVFFAATGVTDCDWLKGVRCSGEGIETSSLVMRAKSDTPRCFNAVHNVQKLDEISGIKYGAGSGLVGLLVPVTHKIFPGGMEPYLCCLFLCFLNLSTSGITCGLFSSYAQNLLNTYKMELITYNIFRTIEFNHREVGHRRTIDETLK